MPEELRVLYHLAATLAAGGVATMFASAASLAHRACVPEGARSGYARLAGAEALARGAYGEALGLLQVARRADERLTGAGLDAVGRARIERSRCRESA